MPAHNIVLVNPPFVYFPNLVRPKYNYCRPPLGLCYISSYLREHRTSADSIRIIDSLIDNHPSEFWIEKILETEPDIVGISTVTPTSCEAARMAAEIKKRRPSTMIVAGGPHATIRPEDLVNSFDIVVIGEGEKTFLEIVERAGDKAALSSISGIAYMQDGALVKTPCRDQIRPLDDIPPPARDLLEEEKYYHSFPYNRKNGLFTTMFTCRGCPNNCYFCGNEALWNRKIRHHSLDYVRRELELLAAGNVKLLFIDDDDFLASKKRALQICEMITETSIGLKWICHACASSIDDEALKIMKNSGCVEIQIGIESGNEKILKKLSKCNDREQIAGKFKLLKKHGVNTWGTFIIGHEDETPDSIMDTINFAKKIDPTYASFIVLLPFPGTQAFDIFTRNGWLTTTDWEDYTWHGDPVFETPALSKSEIVRYRALAQKRFYLRPKKIFNLIIHTIRSGSLREMMRNFYAWLSIVANGKLKDKK